MDYTTLVNQLERSGLSKRPMLLLVTKWDLSNSESLDNYIQSNFRTLWRYLEAKWQKDRLSSAAVSIENDSKGPKVPLKPLGYRDVLNWIVKVLQ